MALGDLQERAKQIDMRESKELQAPLKFLSRETPKKLISQIYQQLKVKTK